MTAATHSEKDKTTISSPLSLRKEAEVRLGEADRELGALESQLSELEVSLEEVLDQPEKKEKIHAKIAKLRQRREELSLERPLLEKRLADLRNRERAAEIDQYLNQRHDLHQQGQEVAREIVAECARLSKGFQRWKELHREDRRCVDILRSLNAGTKDTLPTFSWVTALDATMEVALAEVTTRGQRAAHELHQRGRTNSP
jgi:chromosome segregation ATPase